MSFLVFLGEGEDGIFPATLEQCVILPDSLVRSFGADGIRVRDGDQLFK